MHDYIEREAAIDAVFGAMADGRAVFPALNNLPAADVRPVVRGKWVEHYEPYSTGEEWVEAQYGYECSICGRWEYEKEQFCNCGADMREES